MLPPMRWSIRVARPFGIPVYAHASFLLILALGALQWALPHGLGGAAFGVLATLALFGCVVLHELGHSLAARAFGIRTRQITLLPIGGVAELDGKPRKPLHELVIALAGPAVNVLIAALLAVGLVVFASSTGLRLSGFTELEPSAVTLGVTLLAGNIGLAVFNLLPVFPLDGGRVLRALLAFRFGEHRSLQIAALVGQLGAAALGGWALLTGQVLLATIAVLLFASAGAARAQGALPELLAGLRAGDVCEQGSVVFEPATTVREGARVSLMTAQTVFPVALGREVVGVIDRERIRAASARGEALYVTGIMDRSWPRVHASLPLADVLEILSSGSASVVAVHEGEDLVGFVSGEHLSQNVIPALAARASGGARRGRPTREPA